MTEKPILASASPRRIELLRSLGLDFDILPSPCENEPDMSIGPQAALESVALAKAETVRDMTGTDRLIIAADTSVLLDGAFLGKPRDRAEAAAMLRALSGRRHTVITGVALLRGPDNIVFSETTQVFFRPLTEREINIYTATGEPFDKAGAYGAQGMASLFIERIEGDYFNVVGLPVCRLGLMLARMGINILE